MSTEDRQRRGLDISVALAALACSATVFLANQASADAFAITPRDIGPTAVPNIIATITTVFAVALIVKAFKAGESGEEVEGLSGSAWFSHVMRLGGLFGAYVCAIWLVGFLISTMAFLFISYRWFSRTSWRASVSITIVSSLAIFFLFTEFFVVRLPEGILLGGR
jgi:hypothetical protein